jgi:hypothetical protein
VQSFALSADGYVYSLEAGGNLMQWNAATGARSQIDGNVQSLKIGSDGILYDYQIDGKVKCYKIGYGWI